jgi:hypothetical protein
MKAYTRVVAGIALILMLLAPTALFAQQLAAPLDRSVSPGVTVIQYSGQTLIFTTTNTLRVQLRPLGGDQIEIKIRAYDVRVLGGASGSSQAQTLEIYWQDAQDSVYNGTPPADPWTAILHTEGGWTEK